MADKSFISRDASVIRTFIDAAEEAHNNYAFTSYVQDGVMLYELHVTER